MIFGIFLIVLGTVWLLSNLGYITATVSEIIWPVIIIALGLSFIFKKGHHFRSWVCSSRDEKKEK